jgi:hypothetical protein
MFIKIFTPNENGKIELTIEELEALIQEAVDKASIDKCSKCTRGWSWNDYNRLTTTPNITLLSDDSDRPRRNGEIIWDAGRVTSSGCSISGSEYIPQNFELTLREEDLNTLRSSINGQLNLDFDNTKEN